MDREARQRERRLDQAFQEARDADDKDAIVYNALENLGDDFDIFDPTVQKWFSRACDMEVVLPANFMM